MAEENIEYQYRYRSWDKNVFYANHKHSAAEIAAGWGPWEIIDEQKYNEILGYIAWNNPCHYQAEKLIVTIVASQSFDPNVWIAETQKGIDEAREERVQSRSAPAPVQSMAPTSDVSLFDTYSLANLAETVVRVASSAVSGTAETIGDCASAIGEGISGMCD